MTSNSGESMFNTLMRGAIAWCLIVPLAVLNGVLREALLEPLLGTTAGYALSGMLLSLCIFLVALGAVPRLAIHQSSGYWLVGLYWLVLTMAFEFTLGFLLRTPPEQMLAQYTFADGNLWPIVLAVVVISPRLAARIRVAMPRAGGFSGKGTKRT
ncbi:MAG: hypothetical protein JJU06_01690 [Ectothiorhodospiraceae bacterium]|nr:hypothetical protein [Ectothiorhodospiraceae bacterium]MCH8502831.1 hypothetical protein [Ectothiorhodospiraceae bacterium]